MSALRKPIPEKLVVLTFDDGSISQLRNAGPLLAQLGFGATFFITEGLKIPEDKLLPADERTFMTWPEVKELELLGAGRFEIANHTKNHLGVAGLSHDELIAELEAIDQRCKEYGLPPTSTFCYPGYANTPEAVETLRQYGMGFARRGSTEPNLWAKDTGDSPKGGEVLRGLAYDPLKHPPLLVPTTVSGGENITWPDFVWATEQARDGKACVLTFHGVPDTNYPWVDTPAEFFERCMRYLHAEGFTVIALRELAEYVEPASRDSRPQAAL